MSCHFEGPLLTHVVAATSRQSISEMLGLYQVLFVRGTLQTKGNKGMIVEQDRLIKTNP